MYGQDQPGVRCEKLCQQPHKPRTKRACRAVQYCTKFRTGEEPRPARAPDSDPNQGCYWVPHSGPKWRHCLPKETWRITDTSTGTHF